MFAQILGGAIFLSIGQLIFNSHIGPALMEFAPEVDVEAVLSVGATDFRGVVAPESVAGVVMAYNKAITVVFVSHSSFDTNVIVLTCNSILVPELQPQAFCLLGGWASEI